MRTHTGLLLVPLLLAPTLHADSVNGRRSAVTNVGDVNQDGVADLAVASRDRNRPERVWILSGKDGARLLEIEGRKPGDRFGSEVVAAGDWDGDGTPDLMISATKHTEFSYRSLWSSSPGRTPETGYRRIHSGKDGSLLHEIDSAGANGGGRDVDGDGRAEFLLCVDREIRTISSAPKSSESRPLLRIVSGAKDALTWTSDLNGDGIADFGEFEYALPEVAGRAPYSFSCVAARSGRDGSKLWSVEIRKMSRDTWNPILRSADCDGDGVDDVILSSEDDAVRVYRGQDGVVLLGFQIPNMGDRHSFPSSMDVLGDLDGDGVPELILGANEGKDWCFDAGLCRAVSLKSRMNVLAPPEDEEFGFDVCALGDVNGDGVPDFAVNAERQRGWTPDASSEPAVQVRSGKDTAILWKRRHVDLREK